MSLIARLIEAGTPADLIEEVALLVAKERALEERRKSDRERKRAQRDREAGEPLSRDVTGHAGQAVTTESAPPLSPPNDIYSNPPQSPPITISGARDAFPCPEWCSPGVWADLKRNRKLKKLANTATAHRKFVTKIMELADDEWPPGRLVEAIAANGWGGAYDPRDDRKPTNARQSPSNRNTAELALAKLGMASG